MSTIHIHRRHQEPAVKFAVYDETSSAPIHERPFVLRDSAGDFVDSYRSLAAADCYCRALNAGRAEIHPHRLIGCRVETMGYVR